MLNLRNGSAYIGSSRRVDRRLACHVKSLACGRHHNRRLQNLFNKYGMNAIESVSMLCFPSADSLAAHEQYCIDNARSTLVNVAKKAIVPPSSYVADDVRLKMSELRKLAWQDPQYRSHVMSSLRRQAVRERSSAASRAMWQDKELRAKTIESFRRAQSTPDARTLHSRTATKLWERWKREGDPHKTHEFRSNQGSLMRARWNDPEWRAKWQAARWGRK